MHKGRFLWTLLLTASLSVSVARAATFTFDTLPLSGDVGGLPGETVGWGYTITNDSLTNWLVTTAINADAFLHGTPDSLIFDFPILAPGASVTVSYDPVQFFGLLQFIWDLDAPSGFVNTGAFILSAEWWEDDPFAGGNFIDFAEDGSAAYTATARASAIPEPTTLSLLLIGVGVFAFSRWKTSGEF